MSKTVAAAPLAAAEIVDHRRTRALLACGVVAGPLYLVTAALQVITRDGFDLSRHPLSLLALGELGWIQVANFVVTGVLFIASAVGLRQVLHGGRGQKWAPRLIGAFGASLVGGGIFVADPYDGFPVGAAEEVSWHGTVHNIAPAVGFLALIAACFVLARRFHADRKRGWAAYSVATGLALLVPDLFITQEWFSLVLAGAAVLGWTWASAVAARLLLNLTD